VTARGEPDAAEGTAAAIDRAKPATATIETDCAARSLALRLPRMQHPDTTPCRDTHSRRSTTNFIVTRLCFPSYLCPRPSRRAAIRFRKETHGHHSGVCCCVYPVPPVFPVLCVHGVFLCVLEYAGPFFVF
jgi:hypothetical protein